MSSPRTTASSCSASKRRSATSSSPPETVFFCDENLGRFKFPDRLRAAGVSVRVRLDHFPQGTADTAWIPEVGKLGWILLTIDDRLRYNPLEQRALMVNRVATFVLTSGRTHDEKAEAFLQARRRIASISPRSSRPSSPRSTLAAGRRSG